MWNGYAWAAQGAPGISVPNIVVFTASGTYTPPSNLLRAIVEVIGSGGGGGGCVVAGPVEGPECELLGWSEDQHVLEVPRAWNSAVRTVPLRHWA